MLLIDPLHLYPATAYWSNSCSILIIGAPQDGVVEMILANNCTILQKP
jgi:hypothetical protein